MTLTVHPDDVLVVVDLQNDFLPGGRLAVADGDKTIAPIQRLAQRFDNIVMTQDWHPADHVSFASQHPGKQPFETIELDYGTQVLWPDHCVIGSEGAAFAPELRLDGAQLIIRKGFHRAVDSYSGFREADRKTQTGLAGYLRERGLGRLFVCGLATDFCVAWTALDARAAGFEAFVVEDACRGIDTMGSLAKAWADMEAAGVVRISEADIG
ncbi:MAG TPA: bifunctional nicotinamidase/pyrazinamidase [Devosiaceae bacterium]|jgi:nicotinamidase/pyrazinamidase|nr:bifunctional nicotinamidase/pyrazinamidase [Devosiaceae bacterium]